MRKKRARRKGSRTSRVGRVRRRDSKGRFKASTGSRLRSVFRSKGKPNAAAKQKKNKQAKSPEKVKTATERTVDVKAYGMGNHEAVASRYDTIVTDGFDRREIDVINRTGGVDIVVADTGKRRVAKYSGKNSKGRHNITANPAYVGDPETMTHETVHILQEEDDKRPDVEFNKKLSIHKKCGLTPEDRSLKEAMTESETIARVKNPKTDSPAFYGEMKGDPVAMKDHDIKVIKEGMKGRSKGEAPGVIASVFSDLNIRKYQYRRSKRTAEQHKADIEKKK